MFNFYLKIGIYFVMFIVSLYGLSSFDFNRFLKKNPGPRATALYFCIALIMAYLLGEFIINITYFFNK